jgi:hypothetical protein
VTSSQQGLENALSLERFTRYVKWAGGDRARALELYSLNTKLSEALYTPLQGLELALRNRIHTVMSASHSPYWFQDSSVMCLQKQQKQVEQAFDDLVRQKKQPTPGGVVAALTFSFWTSMLAREYEELWRRTLHAIATKQNGANLERKDFARPLTQIRLLRNRVAHHEPILYWRLPHWHREMLTLTSWLSPSVAGWCHSVERFTAVYPKKGYRLCEDGRESLATAS